MLHGRIDNIQTSRVKPGTLGTRAMLQGGANDLGGTLMEEDHFSHGGFPAPLGENGGGADRDRGRIGRPLRERTTVYGTVDPKGTSLPISVG
ncbi:hypothetical protein GCM10011610_26600 [Nocardia rhizosphaerihabitans]|uniref:Uncharacterized protein n=1 Tax=Nocardia rhizosphaerihabitans TaxID=1691570 RepID=A0ABQ2KGH3_9NOCA|nr:hypothetical protein GCM10011610_26600 [Nocardia rhizosphaerihabitans]